MFFFDTVEIIDLIYTENFKQLRLSGGKKNLKRCEMGEKNCHVCQQKENKSQKLYCVFLFIYICLIVAPEMYLFNV